MKNKTLLYFGIVLGTTILFSSLETFHFILTQIGIPIIYIIFICINLFKKSNPQSNFSYKDGLKESFAFGIYATLIYIIFNTIFMVLRVFIVNKELKYDADIVSEILFVNVSSSIFMALVNGVIYTVILSIITPFFFIKNKTPDKNVILDDEKF